jgi:cystathionine beta-lyase
MGSVSVSDLKLYHRIRATMRMLGLGVSPDDCFLALRGLETMGVRLAHAGRVALDLASQLSRSPAVERVLHPAFSDSPGHAFWRRDFAGSSGLFSAVLRRAVRPAAVAEALAAMRFFSIGASWGGTHSLLVPMQIAKDRSIKRWDPGTTILRLSIGMEDPEDLRDDLRAVIERFERDLSLPE